MQWILSVILVLLVSDLSIGQGNNLEFSSVKWYNKTDITASVDSFQIVVGSNKVLKIESAIVGSATSPTGLFSSGANGGEVDLFLEYAVIATSFRRNENSSFHNVMPIWLPEGTYTLKIRKETTTTAKSYAYVSAIEYNIVP